MSPSLETLGVICGVTAAVIKLTAYVIYGRAIWNGQQPLNPATWGLWVVLTWLNASSYLIMSGDAPKAFASFAGAAACTVVFCLAVVRKSTARFDKMDVFLFIAGLSTAGVWWHWRNATLANLIMQVAIAISMIPTYRKVLADPSSEKPTAWLMWGSVYGFILATVLLRWHGHWPDLAYPVSCGITHTGVGLIARFGKKRIQPS